MVGAGLPGTLAQGGVLNVGEAEAFPVAGRQESGPRCWRRRTGRREIFLEAGTAEEDRAKLAAVTLIEANDLLFSRMAARNRL